MSRPLSDVLEVIDRSIVKALNDKLVAEGYAVDRTVAGILTDEAAWKAAEDAIIADKGFVIEIFGLTNSHEKLEKKIPRVVYIPERLIPGDVGNSPGYRYQFNVGNANYDKLVDPNQTSNYQFKIGIHAKDARQFRVLHSIVAASIPHREFVPLYNDPTQSVLILQYSYQDNPDNQKGILEGFYMYTAVDLFEHEPNNIGTVEPISDVTVVDQDQVSGIDDITVQ